MSQCHLWTSSPTTHSSPTLTAFSTTLLLAERGKGHGVLSCSAARCTFATQGKPLRADFGILALPVLTQNLRVDVREDKEKNLVSATIHLPGVSRENVSVDVHNNLLKVSGESKSESAFTVEI